MSRQFSGRLLRDARTRRHLTREQLAVGAGVSMSSLASYEQARATPGLNAAAALAEAAGVQVDDLLDDPDRGTH